MTDIIDQLLGDFTPTADEGIHRGFDIDSITDAEDDNLLDELAPGGEHTNANPGNHSGIVAAEQDWQQNGAKPFTREDSVMEDVLKHVDGKLQTGGMSTLSDSEVKMRIAALLHLGHTPIVITAYLKKLAEQQLFNREVSAEFLKDQSGLMGFSYLEPNHFNQKSCTASLKHIKQYGRIKAASVKRIAACEGCENCKKDSEGECKCAAYGLPIVGTQKELQSVVARLTGGTSKKASLVQKHNAESDPRPGHVVIALDRSNERDATLTTAGIGSIQKFDVQAARDAAGNFSPKAVKASIDGGKTLTEVYKESKKVYGSDRTERVVRTYLDNLKKTGSRINLAAIDCSLLKGRLTASETIMGKEKCAECTLRNGMHCAHTGGTLLSYPGMEKLSSKRASMATPGQDGVSYMESLELRAPALDVVIGKDRELLDI